MGAPAVHIGTRASAAAGSRQARERWAVGGSERRAAASSMTYPGPQRPARPRRATPRRSIAWCRLGVAASIVGLSTANLITGFPEGTSGLKVGTLSRRGWAVAAPSGRSRQTPSRYRPEKTIVSVPDLGGLVCTHFVSPGLHETKRCLSLRACQSSGRTQANLPVLPTVSVAVGHVFCLGRWATVSRLELAHVGRWLPSAAAGETGIASRQTDQDKVDS
jgi:hypothetical protein